MNSVVWKYESGDKKSIFGRPYTYNGTKWVPDDGVKVDSKGNEKVGAKVSPKEADKFLKENGLEHIDMLSTASVRKLFEHHGVDWKAMSPKERLNELIKIYGTGSGTKTEEKKDAPKTKIEPPVVKEYACKGISTVNSPEKTKEIIANANPQKGRHWGSAESTNKTAQAVAFSSGSVFRPIDNDLKELSTRISNDTLLLGAGMRKYAQERMKQVPRDKYPEIYRGMTLPPEAFQAIMEGKEKNIELTGCTAFTFHKNIMDQYSQSSWTKGFGADKKSVKIVLQRDDHVDKSIGMWHDHKSDPTKPAFELLTGLECVTVTKIEGAVQVAPRNDTRKKWFKLSESRQKTFDNLVKDPEMKAVQTLSEIDKKFRAQMPRGGHIGGSTEALSLIIQGAPKKDIDDAISKITYGTGEFKSVWQAKSEALTKIVQDGLNSLSPKQVSFLKKTGYPSKELNERMDKLSTVKRKAEQAKEIHNALNIVGDDDLSDIQTVSELHKKYGTEIGWSGGSELLKLYGARDGRQIPIIYVTAGRYKEDSQLKE